MIASTDTTVQSLSTLLGFNAWSYIQTVVPTTEDPWARDSRSTHEMEATESHTQTKENLAEFRSVRNVAKTDIYLCTARSPIHIQ
jgi:hypothetical protein